MLCGQFSINLYLSEEILGNTMFSIISSTNNKNLTGLFAISGFLGKASGICFEVFKLFFGQFSVNLADA